MEVIDLLGWKRGIEGIEVFCIGENRQYSGDAQQKVEMDMGK